MKLHRGIGLAFLRTQSTRRTLRIECIAKHTSTRAAASRFYLHTSVFNSYKTTDVTIIFAMRFKCRVQSVWVIITNCISHFFIVHHIRMTSIYNVNVDCLSFYQRLKSTTRFAITSKGKLTADCWFLIRYGLLVTA